ncbi:MAG: putative acyltransferase (DUF342 family) [Cognaticolwellia sp.]|jgi:predicted acyltransferase (DUF342 family)
MTYIKQCLFILLLFVVSSAQAELPPQLSPPLNNLTIYSSAAITMGASSIVGGNIQVEAAATIGASSTVSGHLIAGAAVTLDATVTIGDFVEARDAGTIGADSTVGGHFTTGDAATLGATTIDGNIIVGGDLTAGAAILVGTKAVIGGNVRSGAATSTDFGADTIVNGNATAGTALTLGADVVIQGSAQAGSGAIALGVNSAVAGNARAGTSVTLAANATVGGTITEGSIEQFTNAPKEQIDDQSPQLLAIQAELAAMQAPAENQLTTAMTVSTTLKKGVYHTTALTTTAGIIMTFDGEGVDGHWLINSDSFVAFGASTVIKLLNVTPNSTITWNAGGYISAGASVNLVGSFFAGSYILTGASTTLKGVSDSCGGFFTTTGAVTLGASNLIGTIGCTATPADIPAIHHYEIAHDGQGLTCDAETVLIKACTNESCSEVSTESVTLDFLANGAVISFPSFVGSTDVTFNHSVEETLTFSLEGTSIAADNPLVCDDSIGTSCDMEFTNAGFRFLYGANDSPALPNQTAGSEFGEALKLQAVKNDNGVCIGLFDGDVNVELSQENITPSGAAGLNFNVKGAASGTPIGKHDTFTQITLDFSDDSTATIEEPVYLDAGQIRLHAKYTGVGDNVGVNLVGDSNNFWVSPAKLVVTATASGNSINGNLSTSEETHKAGQAFDFTVTAYNALGTSPGNITANYIPNDIQLLLTRTGPTVGGVDGTFNYGTGTIESKLTPTYISIKPVRLSAFDSGVSSTNSASYGEVGLLTLDLEDVDYGFSGNTITSNSLDIGRFTPAYFEQTVVEQGALFAVCNQTTTFAYTGQVIVSDAEKGAISYLVNPVVELTAKNVQGATVQNYTELGYNKFIATAKFIKRPETDSTIKDKDNNLLPLTAKLFPGTLSHDGLVASASNFGDTLGAGILHYQLAGGDNFFYPRNANSEVKAQNTDIDFLIDQVNFVDSDGIGITNPKDITETTSINLRFGRALIENSFGPETADLPQNFSTQYLNASDNYVLNEQDSCTIYDTKTRDGANNITLTSGTLNKNLTGVNTVTGPLAEGKTRAMILTAPGPGKQGTIDVEYDIYSWLKYDWNWNGVDTKTFGENPTATATFGQFRGNDRIISWKEVFNQ